MFTRISWSRMLILATTLGGLLAGSLPLEGAPPGGGGTGGGTIYFSANGDGLDFATMNSDGSSKTALPIGRGEPSHLLHGGKRWFLQVRELPGESYPNGNTRTELFAVTTTGEVVQLTNQPDIEINGRRYGAFRWSSNDAAVSWTGRLWETVFVPATRNYVFTGNVVEGGIYAAEVVFGVDGPVLLPQLRSPRVRVDLVVSQGNWEAWAHGPTLAPNLGSHDWSPDGSLMVYSPLATSGLWIADTASGLAVPILEGTGGNPVWSPAGNKIAFDNSNSGIETINPDGTGRKAIIQSTATVSVSFPHWSPTGSHLTYSSYDHFGPNKTSPGPLYIYRATAVGGGKTNLTKAYTYATPVAWR